MTWEMMMTSPVLKTLMAKDVREPQWHEKNRVVFEVRFEDRSYGVSLTRPQAQGLVGSLLELQGLFPATNEAIETDQTAEEHQTIEPLDASERFALELEGAAQSYRLSLGEFAARRLRDRLTAWLEFRSRRRLM